MSGRSGLIVAVVLVTSAAASAVEPQPAPSRLQAQQLEATETVASLIVRASAAAYSLDHAEAMALARRAVQEAPDVASTHRTLASVIWQQILFERGAVTVDHYLGGMDDAQEHLPEPAPELDRQFRDALARSIEIAESERDRDERSVVAHYDAGAAYGLEASYKATIGGSLSGAFRSAKRAFDAQERVLDLQPGHPQASTVVGTYRYVISALSLPSRWFAYIVGFGGGKERGIAMLEEAATHPDAQTEARMALMLIYSREGRHDEAHTMALELGAIYPRNRLFVLEAGATAIRAGRADEAEAILTKGLSDLALDPRSKVPGERAVWLYKRGLARLHQRNSAEGAAEDFLAALDSGAQGWMGGRIRIGMGKLADLAGDRDAAVREYGQARAICGRFGDRECEDEARQLQRRPFVMGDRAIE